MGSQDYFFFCAFSAALVTLPADRSLGFTDLMTPTATVCLISRTANRPRGGKSVKVSTHMGFEGTRSTIAASPDLMALGLSVQKRERRGEEKNAYKLVNHTQKFLIEVEDVEAIVQESHHDHNSYD